MGKFKGTAGEWIVNRMDDTFIQNDKGEIITVMHHTGVIKYETMPYNAKLISCAPEMLEMLQKAKEKLRTVDSPVTSCRRLANEINELIKKATE